MEMNLANMPDISLIKNMNNMPAVPAVENTPSGGASESRFASIVNKEINAHKNETGSDKAAGTTHWNESNGRSEQAGNTSDMNRSVNDPQNESDRSEKSVSEAQGKKGPKTDKLLLNIIGSSVAADANGLQANLINQIADPEATDEAFGQLSSQQAQNIPAENGLTAALINQIVGSEITDEELELSDDQQDWNMPAENGVTAALIDQIADMGTDETLEQSDGQQEHSMPAENGLKTDALLYALINSAVNSTDDAAQSNSDNIANGAAVAVETKGRPERGLKAGIFLNDLNNDNKASKNASKGKENLLDDFAQDANIKIASDSSKASVVEKLIERFDRSGKNEQTHLRSADLKQDIENIAISEGNNNSENIQSKLSPELSGENTKTKGLQDYSEIAAKTVQVESASDNAGFLTHTGAKTESGKPAEAGNTTRPAGFTQMLDNIVYVIKGSSKLGVNVEHDILGKLNINLNIEKGILNVHINTSEKGTREFIENNIQHIVDSLAKDGVSVGGFSVGLRNHNSHEDNVFKMNKEQGSREIQVLNEKARISSMNGLVSVFA